MSRQISDGSHVYKSLLKGYAPSLKEIGREFGLSSLATVHKHLSNLAEKGYLKRSWNTSRSIQLLRPRFVAM